MAQNLADSQLPLPITSAGAPAKQGSGSTIALATGLTVGLATLALGSLEIRWIVYITFAAGFALSLILSSNPRAYLVALMILALQANVDLRMMMQPMPSVGSSGPIAFALPAPILVAVMLAIYLLLTETSRLRLWVPELRRPLVGLFAMSVISLFHSSERLISAMFILYLAELYFVLVLTIHICRSRRDVIVLRNLLMIVLLMQSIVYLIENLTGVTFTLTGETFDQSAAVLQRHGGTISTNSLAFGKFVTPLLAMSVATFLFASDLWRKAAAGIAVLGGLALILTFARSCWIGGIFAIGVVVMVALRKGLIGSRTIVKLAAGSAFCVIVLAPLIRVRMDANHSGDYDERVALMHMAMAVIRAHPIVGVGPGVYPYVFRSYLPPELNDAWLYVVHNVYLLRAAEIGVPGLFFFCWLLLRAVRRSFYAMASPDPELVGVAAGVAGGLIGMMWEKYWDSGFCVSNDALLYVLIGLVVALERLRPKPTIAGDVA